MAYKKKYIIGVIAVICFIAIILGVTLSRGKAKIKPKIEKPPAQKTINLTADDLVKNFNTSEKWNIISYSYGLNQMKLDSDPTMNSSWLNVSYPAGSYSPSKTNVTGGIHFYSQPPTFPARKICFSYSVKFPPNFDPVRGGKLLGMWVGSRGAAGGIHPVDAASYRVAWYGDMQAEAYLYVPPQTSPDYKSIPDFEDNGGYGDSLWKKSFNFTRNIVNNITAKIVLNTFDKNNQPLSNGYVSLTINNETEEFDKLIWITNFKTRISGLLMTSFFGGSDQSWAPMNNDTIAYNNFYVSNIC